MSLTKEVRCKVDENVYNAMKKVAESNGSFISVVAKDIIEDHYNKNGSGFFFSLTDYQTGILRQGAEEKGMEPKEYLSLILDKILPNNKMHAVTFHVPKGANAEEIVDWFKPRVESLAKKIGFKNNV